MGQMVGGDEWCRHQYDEMVFVREFNAASPRFAQACANYRKDAGEDPAPSAAQIAQDCRTMAEHMADPVVLCRDWMPKSLTRMAGLPMCRCTFGAIAGQIELCAPVAASKEGRIMIDLEAYSSFHAAYRAKKPALCGDSLLCKQMMGVDVSGEFLAPASQRVCQVLRDKVKPAFDRIEASLSKLAASLGSAADARLSLEVDRRMERIATLRDRLALAQASSGKAAPARRAAPKPN
ncbi:MAG: hypothetical protein HY077_16580 [Elusimicrobia bacterium]|nr:hypothetical protein [Elusimicrobiota bacterium]